MILVIVANNNQCNLYYYDKTLTLITSLNEPSAKLKSKDLASDKPGHYKAMGGRGAYSPSTSPKEVEIDNLAREIAKKVNDIRNTQQIKKIILIAETQMDGKLHQHFNKNIEALITNNIKKDILYMSDKELLQFLQENGKYPD